MKKFTGLYEVAEEIFENLFWEGVEAIVYKEDGEDAYTVGYRSVGSFGDPEHERSISCTVDLSSLMWVDSLMEWGINPDLIGTTDLDEDLAQEYIADALVDHLHYRRDERRHELEQAQERIEGEESEEV